MTVQIFSTTNGERIIANCIYDDEESTMKLNKPFLLKEVMTDKGFTVFPMPLIHTSDDVEINVDSIMIYPCEPSGELKDLYSQLTSSLVLPTKSGGPGLKLV